MDAGIAPRDARHSLAPTPSLAERLEQGAVHVLDGSLPFAVPSEDDQAFLRHQHLHRAKEILFEAQNDRLIGFQVRSTADTQRLRRIFEACQADATRWIQKELPDYAGTIQPFRTCFHVAEEATRCLRVTSRNDLLHIDALHNSGGHRLLRLFVNLNPLDARVWSSSDTLAKALPVHLPKSGLLDLTPAGLPMRLGQEMWRFLRNEREPIDPYDNFMLSFARYLKHSDEFQEKASRKIWRFLPGQAWLAFTDTLIHADLRGRWILDHLFLIPPSACVRPDLAPAAVLNSLRPRQRFAA